MKRKSVLSESELLRLPVSNIKRTRCKKLNRQYFPFEFLNLLSNSTTACKLKKYNYLNKGQSIRKVIGGIFMFSKIRFKSFLATFYFNFRCVCSNGDGRTGVFLALCLSIERLETEDNVNIFQTIRWLRSQRARLVSSLVSKARANRIDAGFVRNTQM